MLPIVYVTGLIFLTGCFHYLCRTRVIAVVLSVVAGSLIVAIASGVTSASHDAPLTIVDFVFGFVIGFFGSFLPNGAICVLAEMAISGLSGLSASEATTVRASRTVGASGQSRDDSMPRLTLLVIAFIHFVVCVGVIAAAIGVSRLLADDDSTQPIRLALLALCGAVTFPVSILFYYFERLFSDNLTATCLLLVLNSFAVSFLIVNNMGRRRQSRDKK